MIGSKVSATDGSTAVGRDNNAPIINANDGATVNVNIEHKVMQELPSFLGDVIGLFSKQDLSHYDEWMPGGLRPEIIVKLEHNDFPDDHRLISEYIRYGLVLERAYHGAEQQNTDARLMVRRRAALAYEDQLALACKAASVSTKNKLAFVKANAEDLVKSVISQLLDEYSSSKLVSVRQETAHLAISLIVADAVIECEVLERPKKNAITS
jgi:hypothetical protein